MVDEEKDVLHYIEHLTKVPPVITLKRTTRSKYQFHLLVRAVAKKLGLKPRFTDYEGQKAYQDTVKASIEEHNLFESRHLHVLEGFSLNFVSRLSPPPGSYIVAETDDGELETELYRIGRKRDILKVLMMILGMELRVEPSPELSLRALNNLDWSFAKDFEDYEPILLKGWVMKWTPDQIKEKELIELDQGNLLTLIKRSDFGPLFDMASKFGEKWVSNRITDQLAQLIYYRSLRQMMYDEKRAAEAVGVGKWRAEEIEAASKMLTQQDVHQMAQRLVSLDFLTMTKPGIGLQLLVLNAPIRVKR